MPYVIMSLFQGITIDGHGYIKIFDALCCMAALPFSMPQSFGPNLQKHCPWAPTSEMYLLALAQASDRPSKLYSVLELDPS